MEKHCTQCVKEFTAVNLYLKANMCICLLPLFESKKVRAKRTTRKSPRRCRISSNINAAVVSTIPIICNVFQFRMVFGSIMQDYWIIY